MKKTLGIIAILTLCTCVANAFPETSSFNNREMQQIQHLQTFQKGSINEFRDFKQQQIENQERIKRDIERQQRHEERVQQTTPKSQFVNDNGVIRIENSF